MTPKRIPIARPDLSEHEKANVRETLARNWISQGPFVEQAERELCRITGRKHAICVSSGTTALIIALMAIDNGWRPRHVGAPALTFAAVHNAIRLVGGTPDLQPADRESWQVSYRQFGCGEFIAAPCYGKLEGLSTAETLSKEDQLVTMIEDAAESFLGTIEGRPAGSFGLISCVSFYANKICTSGEGGAILTDDQALALRLRAIANHGIVGKGYVSLVKGLNGRMTDLQAAVLCGQLARVDEMLTRRREIMALYVSAAKGKWRLPTIADGEVCAPWLFAGIPEGLDEMVKRCEAADIEWRPLFPVPMSFASDLNEPTVQISRSGLCLPLSSALTDDEVERVCRVIRGN